MKPLIFFVAMALSIGGFSQELLWESGVLITKSNEVLTGSIIYHAAHNAVLLKHNDTVNFFPSHKIQSFRFYDSKAEINRQFMSIERSDFFSRNAILEIVVNGSIKIIRRLKSSIDELGKADDATDFSYFVIHENEIIPVQKFKSNLLPFIMMSHQLEIKEFIRQSKIDINSATAAFQVIKEHNRLVAKPNLIATLH